MTKPEPKRDVTYEAVDTMTRRGVENGIPVEKARNIAIDSATRINRKRRDGK